MADFISGILATEEGTKRAAILKQTHPLHARYSNLWNVGLDAYDGSGGFLDGAYLWQFPREESDDYQKRKAMARYHNYAEALVDIYVRHVTNSVERSTTDDALMDWWTDVDGRGQSIDNYTQAVLGPALAAGHAGTLIDKSPDDPTGPSRADDPNRPYLVTVQSPAILDWRTDRRGLAAIKLAMEPTPVSLAYTPTPEQYDYLLWDHDTFARFNHKGVLIGGGEPGLGIVPFEVCRPKPSRRHPFIGKALITPSVVQALYNRASEQDVVLRDQAFSLFLVSVPADTPQETIDFVQGQLNKGAGTKTAQIVVGTADYKTADMQVPAVLQDNQSFLVAEMYRMAHLRFDRGSLQAQSGEALRIQRQELEQTLVSMAATMREYELALVERYYDWTAPDGAVALERAKVEIVYPTDFQMRNLEDELAGFTQAAAMGLGQTAGANIKERVVSLILPDLDPKTLEIVKGEIGALSTASPALDRRAQAESRLREAGVAVVDEAAV